MNTDSPTQILEKAISVAVKRNLYNRDEIDETIDSVKNFFLTDPKVYDQIALLEHEIDVVKPPYGGQFVADLLLDIYSIILRSNTTDSAIDMAAASV